MVIIGGGFGGIGAAIALKRAGIHDFVILERADDLGGTWRDNTYPDVGVDVPSFAYQFSFEKNPHWSRVFAKGAEVKAYLDHCADKYGVRPHVRFGQEVVAREWDEERHGWRIRLRDGELTARYVIAAIGAFVDPRDPDIPGIEDFAGKLIRSQEWDHAHDLGGRRVGVIGTGASALQLIPPVAERAARLHVFQRRPIWVFAKPDFRIAPWLRRVFAHVPGVYSLVHLISSAVLEYFLVTTILYGSRVPPVSRIPELACRAWLWTQVRDRDLRRRLTPGYGFGCKRPSMSNSYYRAFTKPTTELVTDRIARITPRGVLTEDGQERELDVLVLATGFHMAHDPVTCHRYPVIGRDGFDVAAAYERDPLRTYEGVSLHGVPNTFSIFGPFSWTGASWHVMVEAQSTHVVRVLQEARRRGATRVEVRPEAEERFVRFVTRRVAGALPLSSRCDTAGTYYRDHHGEATLLRPTSSLQAVRASRSFPLDDYEYRRAA